MRFYTFINAYLSQIQQGIQTAHILGEMVSRETNDGVHINAMADFLKNHKTIIVCNGGNNERLRELIEVFSDNRNPYQWDVFHEDAGSLDGALTGVGILLPETIYDVRWDREEECYIHEGAPGYISRITPKDNGYFFELTDKIKSFRLA